MLSLGFGPAGVVAGSAHFYFLVRITDIAVTGSLAASFQAWMYGGFTPAAGIFATFTSLGMIGLLNPIVGVISIVFGAVAALIAAQQTPC